MLPVLPILLAGTAPGGPERRPLAIIGGLVASFTAFTLGGAWLLTLLGLPQDILRDLALALLFVLAATLFLPALAELAARPFQLLMRRRSQPKGGGFVFGVSVGLVFVPCAGPVLAAVTALSATGDVGVRTLAVTLSYALGVAIPMLLFAIGGRRLTGGLRLLRVHAREVRYGAGAILAVTAGAIALGLDQRLTTAIPGYTSALQDRIERSNVARRELRKIRGAGQALAASATSAPLAPEFRGISTWLNTPGGKPLSLAALRGKVVLVDFWTYSCINCLRTLPHLKAWDRAYRRDGLVIVGVHTPEFSFERVPSNVKAATKRLGVRYPVALDNGYGTWNAYANEYWPAEYLIDRTGRVRRTHFGEGEYAETEEAIRRLLGRHLGRTTAVADATPESVTTPESYLGYGRLDRYGGSPYRENVLATYRFPASLPSGWLAYAGRWRVELQRIVAGREARLRLRFHARKVHLVLGGTGRVRVLVDGRPVRTVRVEGPPRLYTLLSWRDSRDGLLELRVDRGIAGYAFTFG